MVNKDVKYIVEDYKENNKSVIKEYNYVSI